jgi:hypothetical protein
MPLTKLLRAEIEAALPKCSARVWHGHPVWFDGVSYFRCLREAAKLARSAGVGADSCIDRTLAPLRAPGNDDAREEAPDILVCARRGFKTLRKGRRGPLAPVLAPPRPVT